MLAVGLLVTVLAGVDGGTASAQTGTYFFSDSATQPLVGDADTERTNVTFGGTTNASYDVPYIEVNVELYAGTSATPAAAVDYQLNSIVNVDRGFTHDALAIDTTANTYISWRCLTTQRDQRDYNDPAPVTLPMGGSDSFQSAFLPYTRELTLTHNAGTEADMKVCVAPEALTANTNYGASTINAYTPPTGWSIASSEIITPEDGATVEYTFLAIRGSVTSGMGLITGSQFRYTATYNTSRTLSFSCLNGANRLTGAADNSFCTTTFTQAQFIPYYSESSLREFVTDADSVFTNVNPDGTDNDTTYDVPYIRVLALLYPGVSATASTDVITQGTLVVGRGFTHSDAAIDATNTYMSWDCSVALQVDTSDTATTTLATDGVVNALNDAILPYARELTLTHDAGTETDMTVCVAPEALTDNPSYGVSTITAYTAPAGWTIESSEIITPDNGAFISHSRIANRNTIALGNELTDIFSYVATYNTAGDKIGNAGNALSFTCTGGSDRLTGAPDNSFCTRGFTPALSPSSPDTGEPPPSFGTTGATTIPAASVSCGFQVDGLCRDITRSTNYVGKTLNAGSTHSFALKAYTPTTFSRFQLGIGATSVGAPIGTAQVVITVIVTRDYSTATGYSLSSVTYGNNSAEEIIPDAAGAENINATITAITQPADNSNVTLVSEPCAASQPTQCLVVNIDGLVFTDTFISPIYAIAATDTQSKLTTSHLR